MNPLVALSLLAAAGKLLGELRSSSDDEWREILGSEDFLPARRELEALLRDLDDDALRKAIDALSERQERLLAGRRRKDLSTPELNAYQELGDLKQILAARRVRIALDADFATWLVDHALPALALAAPYLPMLRGAAGERT